MSAPEAQGQADRPYDIVLFGATGFTGGLVARYLARHAPAEVRWALAGRSLDKLKAVEESLYDGALCPPRGILLARVDDASSMRVMAQSARVLLTTVGPYIEYGEPAVKACAAAGTHYVDLTGEPLFVHRMIDRYDAEARESGAKIVPCCGFDSIPHDLGVLFTLGQLPTEGAVHVEGFVRTRGTFSGGTWHSAIRAMAGYRQDVREIRERRRMRPRLEGRSVRGLPNRIRFEPELRSWVAPMPTIDPEIVLMSARALPRYGPDFRYGHYAQIRRLPVLIGGALGIGAVFGLAQLEPTRKLLLKLRDPGEGPSEEARAKAWFHVTFLARAGGKRVRTEVRGGDPGYGETAKMIAESALCLALDQARLPERAGVITTAVAMGEPLIERLRAVGIEFRVVEEAR